MYTSFEKYESCVKNSAIYPKEFGVAYAALGLNGEAGEVAEKVKKIIRDKDYKNISETDKLELLKELGDCLWYITAMANDLGSSLENVAMMNAAKITSRKERNVQHGSGDNR